MLKIIYNPSHTESISDGLMLLTAERYIQNCANQDEMFYVFTGQVLFIDAIRCVMAQHNINPEKVFVEVRNATGEHIENVYIDKHYGLTSWKSIPAVQMDILRDLAGKKYDSEDNQDYSE